MADPDLQNISRIDAGSTHGWTVRFQRGGEKHQRFFNDGRHGGKGAALGEAQAWRDEQRERLGPVRQDASQFHTREARERNRRSVSRTGVTGISVSVRAFAGSRVPYVTAYWVDEDGRRRQTSFSTARHGVDGALRLAARARAATSDWHGAEPQTAEELAEAARPAVEVLAVPGLPLAERITVLNADEAAARWNP